MAVVPEAGKQRFADFIRKKLTTLLVVAIGLTACSFFIYDWFLFQGEIRGLRQNFENGRRGIIKSQVTSALEYIRFQQKVEEDRLRTSLRAKLGDAFQVIQHLYDINQKHASPARIEEIIRNILFSIRWKEGRGYIYAFGTDLRTRVHPRDKLGTDLSALPFIRNACQIALEKGEGYLQYQWEKQPGSGVLAEKLVYVRYFQPLDWIVGCGEYLDDQKFDSQVLARRWLEEVRQEKENSGKLFVLNYAGSAILGDLPSSGLKSGEPAQPVAVLIEAARQPGGAFREMFLPAEDAAGGRVVSRQLIFAQGVPGWDWAICASISLDDLETLVGQRQASMGMAFLRKALVAVFIFFTLLWLALAISRRFYREAKDDLESFTNFFQTAADHAVPIEADRLRFAEFDQLARRANEMVDRRNQAEKIIRRYEEIFRCIRTGICLTNTGGQTLEMVNPAFAEMHGRTAAEMEGWPVDACYPPAVGSATMQRFARIMEEGHLVYEAVHQRADGSTFTALHDASILRDESGEALYVIVNIQDISDRKLAEQAILQARREAEAASQAKSDFMANMSHEIRTPLHGIVGLTGLLQETPLNEEQQDHVATIKLCTESLRRVIEDVLNFAKLEAGQFDLENQPFNLPALLDSLLDTIEFQAEEKKLSLSCQLDLRLSDWFIGDAGRLRQVLANLAGNAIKFTPSGEVAVRVELIRQSSGRAEIKFEIQDTGIGIPAAKQERLFDPFYQADASSTRQFGGTGLGLAISRHLVELMGGHIGFTSQDGRGSVFWFTIPLACQPGEPGPRLALDGVKALTVISQPLRRQSLESTLTSGGAACTAAAGADSARQLLAEAEAVEQPYTLIILDEAVSGLDRVFDSAGHWRTELKQDPALFRLVSQGRPVIQLREKPRNALLPVPVRPSLLLDCLQQLFSVAGRTLPATPKRPSVPPGRRPSLRHARILLAEDNPINQKVVRKMLEYLDITEVEIAANGNAALSLLQERPFDLLLLDVQMPHMDGYETARRIRCAGSGVQNPDIPVVALTAHALSSDREKCLQAGMNDYLAKPVELNELAAVLHCWLPEPGFTGREIPVPASTRGLNFDFPALLGRLNGDRGLAVKLLQTFVTGIPEQLQELETAARSSQYQELIRLAHGLKSAAGMVEASCFAELMRRLEKAGREKDGDLTGQLLAEAKSAFQQLEPVMNSYLPGRFPEPPAGS